MSTSIIILKMNKLNVIICVGRTPNIYILRGIHDNINIKHAKVALVTLDCVIRDMLGFQIF